MQQDIRVSVLLAEDNDVFAQLVEGYLTKQASFKVDLHIVDSIAGAISRAAERPLDVVLLDLGLTDSNGLDTLRRFHQSAPGLPIIVMTAYEDDATSLKALQEGAQDYLPKSELSPRLLSRAILYAIERVRLAQQRDSFMSAIIHDLKNPLVGSDRLLDLILSEHFGQVPAKLEEVARTLKDSNDTMLHLLKNLLDIYRYEFRGPQFHNERLSLAAVMRDCVTQVKPLADAKKLKLTVDLEDDGRKINADQLAMRRVFLNLLGNAIKFTGDGGTVAVELRSLGDRATLLVQDNGDGISTEEQRYLFQRFYQSTSGRKHAVGTGLGLYVCRQIIEAHGGSIDCRSSAGRGTVITVTMPLLP